MVSTVSGGLEAATAGASSALSGDNRGGYGGNSLNLYQFQNSGDQAVAGLSRSLIDIPDTLTRNQGAACSIFVARDLSFADVYQLVAR